MIVILTHLTQLVLVISLIVLAFWRGQAVLFLIAGGMAAMVGLTWGDVFVETQATVISLSFIALWLILWGYAFVYLFARKQQKDETGNSSEEE